MIKHDGHDFRRGQTGNRYLQISPGRRLRRQRFFSKNRYMINADEEIDLQQLINGFSDADVILVEGMKQSELPKIENRQRESIPYIILLWEELDCCCDRL